MILQCPHWGLVVLDHQTWHPKTLAGLPIVESGHFAGCLWYSIWCRHPLRKWRNLHLLRQFAWRPQWLPYWCLHWLVIPYGSFFQDLEPHPTLRSDDLLHPWPMFRHLLEGKGTWCLACVLGLHHQCCFVPTLWLLSEWVYRWMLEGWCSSPECFLPSIFERCVLCRWS